MVLKANDRRTSCPCHDEFREPRSDYVRQVASENNNNKNMNNLKSNENSNESCTVNQMLMQIEKDVKFSQAVKSSLAGLTLREIDQLESFSELQPYPSMAVIPPRTETKLIQEQYPMPFNGPGTKTMTPHQASSPVLSCQRVLWLDDNARLQSVTATQNHIATIGLQRLYHPPNSPDLAPSEFHLFPVLKKNLA
ncbi:hypothetical protein TNCV_3413571 [Trichonephila clavipes]|uniref:Uncharacterized protein n=1 Tax=Trichonephila clavipes TaxID=2585209 RepID=A0A8X6RG34_TRICX|nr:hypothetical protein TNCV_3413571 [Trichonephila clavipes]